MLFCRVHDAKNLQYLYCTYLYTLTLSLKNGYEVNAIYNLFLNWKISSNKLKGFFIRCFSRNKQLYYYKLINAYCCDFQGFAYKKNH